MLAKYLKGLLAAAALACLAACSTPCDAPGRLCAPIHANTSAPPRAAVAVPAPPPAVVETMPVEAPPTTTPAAVTRIGLMLPLRSENLGAPAEAVRAGFMAAHEREGSGVVVTLIDSGETAQEALDAYAAAVAQNDIMVGPLARSAVSAVASSPLLAKPTIALNFPDSSGNPAIPLPQNMLVMGLSIEDEARQVAAWAGTEHAEASALIVSGASTWQHRIAAAFAAQWGQLGRKSQLVELPASNGYLSDAAIAQLKTRVEADTPALLFAALDADQLRQVRTALGPDLPCYGTSSVNPGSEPGNAMAELDGLRLLDLPWEVQPDHPAVMVYPRWIASRRTLDLDRLYALGIDAYRVALEIAQHPSSSFRIDGVTGRLQVSFGRGAARFERILPVAVYQGGAFKLVANRP
ncbi:MAG: penicillin-binding protein activator [Pseudomonadota bacterium]